MARDLQHALVYEKQLTVHDPRSMVAVHGPQLPAFRLQAYIRTLTPRAMG